MTPATAAALDLVLGALELVVRVLGAWRSRGHIDPADIMAAAEKMELERRTDEAAEAAAAERVSAMRGPQQ